MRTNVPKTKERIIKAASRLFQREGVRDVSLDMIASEADLTKRTIYYHFRSKDDIITAYLQSRDQPNLNQFQKWFKEAEGELPDKIEGVFVGLTHVMQHPRWKGCGFLRTSVELIKMPGHPAVQAAQAHKKRVEMWLTAVFSDYGLEELSPKLAKQIMLLLEGSFSMMLLHKDTSYVREAGKVANLLTGQCLCSLQDGPQSVKAAVI